MITFDLEPQVQSLLLCSEGFTNLQVHTAFSQEAKATTQQGRGRRRAYRVTAS